MSDFERQQPAYRLVGTQYGDTLPLIAGREIADANRWVELIWLNGLSPPYITDDPRLVAPGVLLSGSKIKVPVPTGFTNSEQGNSYESDVSLSDKRLTANAAGDFAIFSGVDNLKQQLTHRVVTPRGQSVRHPDYGCLIWRLQGKANGPVAKLLASEYVKSSLAADYRVAAVKYSVATIDMDAIKIDAQVTAIDGGSVDIRPSGDAT